MQDWQWRRKFLIVWCVDLSYDFEFDWLILTTSLNVIGLFNCR